MPTPSRTNLRFRRGDGWRDGPRPTPVCPGTLRFAGGGASVRERLVAGTVDMAAVPEDDGSPCPVVGRIGRDGADEFLRGLESTLGRMQRQLDDLRRECDEAMVFPFPVSGDDAPRPRAA